jgi:hypothetical protein
MSPYITPPSKRGVTTREDRQEVARSALVNGMESKMATLMWRAAPGCLQWNCTILTLRVAVYAPPIDYDSRHSPSI